jgi:hypothetical protein
MASVRSFAHCLALAALAGAGPVAAQSESPFTFGLGGSFSFPVADASVYGLGAASNAWQGMGLFQIRPFGTRLGFQLDGTYQPFTPTAALAGRQVFNGTANVLYEFGRTRTSKVVPYVIGGAGVYSFRDRGLGENAYHFGLNGGAGLNLRIFGPGTFFLESRFHNVFNAGFDADGNSSAARLVPITAGFKFTGP